jgi:hypothetical protein
MLAKMLRRMLNRPRPAMTIRPLGRLYNGQHEVIVGEDLCRSFRGTKAECLRFAETGGAVRP